jgi:ribosomal RNA-processing protein 17
MFAQPRPKKNTLQPPPKKRKTVHKIEEITFDKDSRTEYLSGFRKRKQARIKQAQEIAAKKEREERIEMRKQVSAMQLVVWCSAMDSHIPLQIREERRQAVEEHVKTVHQILREAQSAGTAGRSEDNDDSDDEWNGLDDDVVPEPPIDIEEEYIDEDRFTTVTVEAVNVDRDGLHKPGAEVEEDATSGKDVKDTNDSNLSSKTGAKEWPKKKKKKSFRYETKLERRLTERKQKAKRDRR